ncbi:MAG TPA: dTDP-4-amino-4,6-dideoxygalactose transaminase [Mucilaginibacter sp.]|jgi:dTDP-4-amino-4,6-dideoxygalactose transaminase|nr:dTDP-4-amino-4,6-dideoxygalactose transaminase [Mucilaginibacter sp.]
MNIPFNKPYKTGKELEYIQKSIESGKISGDGIYTKKCHDFFENRYGFKKCLLTTSCTDALELAAILIGIEAGDEVIMPSYTFVSTANAFVLRGASIVFADSRVDHPGIDEETLESLITPKTKAIVIVHYAGISCDMDKIKQLADRHSLFTIEDAAQAIDSYYIGKDNVKTPLGSIGHLAAFSFHETKNIISGEGGMLVINDERFSKRAEIIREKGTNRSAFFRGEVNKYGWVDLGSSFLPSDIIAAFLFAQLENLDEIQERRQHIWNLYKTKLQELQDARLIKLPFVPPYSTNNYHMFYLLFDNIQSRESVIKKLKEQDILSVFHYISLHKSPFYLNSAQSINGELVNSDYYTDCLLRLPFYVDLSDDQISKICSVIKSVLYKSKLDKLMTS